MSFVHQWLSIFYLNKCVPPFPIPRFIVIGPIIFLSLLHKPTGDQPILQRTKHHPRRTLMMLRPTWSGDFWSQRPARSGLQVQLSIGLPGGMSVCGSGWFSSIRWRRNWFYFMSQRIIIVIIIIARERVDNVNKYKNGIRIDMALLVRDSTVVYAKAIRTDWLVNEWCSSDSRSTICRCQLDRSPLATVARLYANSTVCDLESFASTRISVTATVGKYFVVAGLRRRIYHRAGLPPSTKLTVPLYIYYILS